MKYKNGIEVMEGDVVAVHRDGGSVEGVILKLILSNTPDAEEWESPNGGVLIEGGGLGLFVAESLAEDEDIGFVRRAL
ncbi:MAG TPA: hypothetical protein PK156_15515 [Polyangium sp.]|nr:hypothetical protein [Polyangium sp.]